MNRRFLIIGLIAACLSLGALNANAGYIDFLTWNPTSSELASGSVSRVVDGTTVTVTAYYLHTTPARPSNYAQTALYWDNRDGFGVTNASGSYEHDEVEGNESLWVSFDSTMPVTGFALTDFFYERARGDGHLYQERGTVALSSEDDFFSQGPGNFLGLLNILQTDISTPGGPTNGEYVHSLGGPVDLRAMGFRGIGDNNSYGGQNIPDGEGHEFSLAGVETAQQDVVPEPGTMILFGSAAGLMGWLRRRKAHKA